MFERGVLGWHSPILWREQKPLLLLLPTTSFPLNSEVLRKDTDGLTMRPDHEEASGATYLRH